ncbi:MAG: UDP-N-acetylglucosamine pyrophosphorylase [Oscillospiraceae bacterium]|jgi:bifunctional UDP-N-acetylglucosamine pyrophosphorylase/glucosamine-1-phosphate N-acetyltransferase|nr:UDP-N-acetylglucosamine pyrophosphorylase [Oscillospiraceae bacterium]
MERYLSYYFANLEDFPFTDIFGGCEFPWQVLLRVKELMKSGQNRIGAGSVIHPSAEIKGPVWIGENAEIGHGALIRPYTVVGNNCSVGHGSEVKHSILLNGSKVASLAFVGDSFLGKSARIGSGVITANRKFNQSNVTVKGEDLNSDYFGLVLGDNSRLGANSVTQPGTHIGRFTWVYPLTNIRGFVPSNKRVYHERALTMEENESLELS